MKRLLPVLASLVAGALAVSAANLPTIPSSPQYAEASQIIGTLNALIGQLNGGTGYSGSAQLVSLGTACTATGTTAATCSAQRGQYTLTAVPAITVGGTSGGLVITNTQITAANVCNVTPLTSTTGLVFVSSVVVATNGFTMTLGSAGSYAGGSMTFMFNCV
jgi:hypothetical protein